MPRKEKSRPSKSELWHKEDAATEGNELHPQENSLALQLLGKLAESELIIRKDKDGFHIVARGAVAIVAVVALAAFYFLR